MDAETRLIAVAVGAWCVIIGTAIGLVIAKPKPPKEK